jgi:hypothetical protein
VRASLSSRLCLILILPRARVAFVVGLVTTGRIARSMDPEFTSHGQFQKADVAIVVARRNTRSIGTTHEGVQMIPTFSMSATTAICFAVTMETFTTSESNHGNAAS